MTTNTNHDNINIRQHSNHIGLSPTSKKTPPDINAKSESLLNAPYSSLNIPDTNSTNSANTEQATSLMDKSHHVSKFLESAASQVDCSDAQANLKVPLLPRYGLREQSAQTNLTGRDIDEYECVYKEFRQNKEDYVKSFLRTNKEMLRMLFCEEKMSSIQSTEPEDILLNRMRKNSDEVLLPEKRKYTRLDPAVKKERRDAKAIKRQIKNEAKTKTDLILVEEDLDQEESDGPKGNNASNSNANPNEAIRHRTEAKKSRLLNGIKPGRKKDLNSHKEEVTEVKKKFDAYHSFKREYRQSHLDMSEEELETDCRKEWNTLDKELKKIYNIDAESERKKYKQSKKIAKELQRNNEKINN